jgi:hypothetical protein
VRRLLPALRLAGLVLALLVLALLVLAWWPVSWWWSLNLLSPRGCLDIEFGAAYIEPGAAEEWGFWVRKDAGAPYERFTSAGVHRWKPLRVLSWNVRRLFVVPLWFPAVLLAMPWAWVRWRRRSAGPQGRGFEVRT